MANICKYSMRIKGLENVAMIIAETTPWYNNKNIHTVSVEDNVCILEVNGDCKRSARDSLIELKGVIPNDLDLESRLNEVDEEIMDVLCDVSILEKSKFFKCEVEITTKSTDSEFAEVSKDIPDNSVVVGNPAQIVGTYDAFVEKTKNRFETCPVFKTHYSKKTDEEKREMKEILTKQGQGFDV